MPTPTILTLPIELQTKILEYLPRASYVRLNHNTVCKSWHRLTKSILLRTKFQPFGQEVHFGIHHLISSLSIDFNYFRKPDLRGVQLRYPVSWIEPFSNPALEKASFYIEFHEAIANKNCRPGFTIDHDAVTGVMAGEITVGQVLDRLYAFMTAYNGVTYKELCNILGCKMEHFDEDNGRQLAVREALHPFSVLVGLRWIGKTRRKLGDKFEQGSENGLIEYEEAQRIDHSWGTVNSKLTPEEKGRSPTTSEQVATPKDAEIPVGKERYIETTALDLDSGTINTFLVKFDKSPGWCNRCDCIKCLRIKGASEKYNRQYVSL